MRHVRRRIVECIWRVRSDARAKRLRCWRDARLGRRSFGPIAASSGEQNKHHRGANRTKPGNVHMALLLATCDPLSIERVIRPNEKEISHDGVSWQTR